MTAISLEFGDESDFLNLRKFGDRLSATLQGAVRPQAVLIDGRWGYGKTDFSHRFQSLLSDTYFVIRFDAFEWDLSDHAFAAIVSQIYRSLHECEGEDEANSFLKKAAYLAKNVGQELPKAALLAGTKAVAGKVGSDLLEEMLSDTGEHLVSRIFRDEVLRMSERDRALKELVKEFERIEKHHGRRVVLIIDELDRCRGDFAREVLDVVHHIFAMPNIVVFVFANSEALQDSGATTGVSALNKFFDLRVQLPAPHDKSEFGHDTYVSNFIRRSLSEYSFDINDGYTLASVLEEYFLSSQCGFREVKRALDHIRMISASWSNRQMDYAITLFLAIALKYVDYERFKKFQFEYGAKNYFIDMAKKNADSSRDSVLIQTIEEMENDNINSHNRNMRKAGGFDRYFQRISREYVDGFSVNPQ